MRRPSDLSRRRVGRRRFSGRGLLIVLGALILFVVIFGRAVARFYVDYLWHDGLGRSDVFWGVIRAKGTLFGLFFLTFVVLAGINMLVADRLAPKRFPANVHPVVERFHEVFGQRLRLVRYGAALVLAFIVALPTTSQWQQWLLFRNSQSFGRTDAQFGADVGFYVFELPFLAFVLDWLFVATALVLVLTIVAHVLNGGVLFASPVPSIRPATKGHIAVLLAVLAALKAADYWLSRYQTTNERRGFVQGATYAVVNAQLPALMLLLLIAVLTAGLFLSVLRSGSFRLPLLASGLWLIVLIAGGYIYPAAIQSLVVNPNQQSREGPYITRNVLATRAAMGLEDVLVTDVSFGRLTAEEIADDVAPLRDVRLLHPGEMLSRFRVDEGVEAGLTIDDLDVDRYELDGQRQQVLIAARELDIENIPNQSWQGRHVINTRGCGLVMAPTNRVSENDRPAYERPDLERPELYFSPSLSGYAVARTTEDERDCGENEPYSGEAGVKMSSVVRRAAFALAFLDYNVLGSGAIREDSQMLWVRNVRDRLHKLAPFLSYDGDPYPVIDDGRVLWVVDAYTSTSQYPYAQRVGNTVQLTQWSGISRDANYIRNSVKAVVDAYDGSVSFFVVDEADPIIQAWEGAFGDLFTPMSAMPAELAEHLRYPEDLFRVQTDVYSKYRLAPADFFQREGAWSVAQAPSVDPSDDAESAPAAPASGNEALPDLAADAATDRFVPYYTMFRPTPPVATEAAGDQPTESSPPLAEGDGTEDGDEGAKIVTEASAGEADQSFVLLRPFVPFSRNDIRTELAAYMTASSDPETYGQLVAYVVTGESPDGPRTVANQIDSAPAVADRISQQTAGNTGNRINFGDLQLVPIADGIVYVRPMYAAVQQSSGNSVTEYRFVTVAHEGRAAIGESMGQALASLFPGFEGDLGDRVAADDGTEPAPSDEGDAPPTPEEEETPAELLARADVLFSEAEAALADGDLGAYQSKVDEAAALVQEALEALENG